jgi:phosphatidylglycerol:prolipoprotein diacylglycerol transferase
VYPELFHIGPVPIRSFGLMIALAFLFGVLYIMKTAKRDRKPIDQFITVAYIMIFAGMLGARIFYVLFHLEEFSGNWLNMFNPFHDGYFGIAGLNLYGGIVAAIGSTMLYCHRVKLKVLDVFDYFAPTLGLGIGIARIGCFLNGCCFGTPTDLPWGVTFPSGSIPALVFGDAHLHPSQLYSSIYGLLLFAALHALLKRRAFIGQIVAILFMCEAVFRFLIEYVRFYESEMIIQLAGASVTYNQLIAVGLFAVGLGVYSWQKKRQVSAA